MNDHFHFDVRIVQDDQVTMVAMETEGFGHLVGSAKRHPIDDHNPVIGQCVALSRMFRKVADHYDLIVEALTPDQSPTGEMVVVNPVEADWLKHYNVPSEEMG